MLSIILIAGGLILFMKFLSMIFGTKVNEKVWTYYAATPNPKEDNCYKFRFHENGGKWRAYIERTPSYRGRVATGAVAHWLMDGGKRYICIRGGDVTSLERMQALTMTWADRTQRYIRTGISMNNP